MKFSHIIVLTGTTAITLIAGCSQNNSKREVKQSGVDSVSVFSLKKEQINKQITFPAELTPLERAEIYAKVSGYIN